MTTTESETTLLGPDGKPVATADPEGAGADDQQSDVADAIGEADAEPGPLPVVVDAPSAPVLFSPTELSTLKATVAASADLSDLEFDLFVAVCRRTGLDPFVRQIHPVKRYNRSAGGKVMVIQTGIDGYRLVAERTGQMRGQVGPEWCGPDGQWVDVWLDDDHPPHAARVGVLRAGWEAPLWSVAKWSEYAAKDREGKLTGLWPNMASHMIAKCAEALSLRRAFPNELSGIYTDEEMEQADLIEATARDRIERPTPPQAEPAPDEVRAEIQARIDLLPQPARAELGQWWAAQVGCPVAELNRRQIPKAKAKVQQVEELTLAGEWGPEAAETLRTAQTAALAQMEAQAAETAAQRPQGPAEPEPAAEWCEDCERQPCKCPAPDDEAQDQPTGEAVQPTLMDEDPDTAPM